jgi:hypothetical protein
MAPIRRTMIISMTFQQGLSSSIPQKSPPPFGSSTTTNQLICIGILSRSQMVWIILTKIPHFVPSSPVFAVSPGFSWATFSLRQISLSHIFTCSALIPVAPVACPFFNPETTACILLSVGTPSGISKCEKLKGRGVPMVGALGYNSTCSAICFAIVSGHAGGGRSSTTRYHPLSARHTSLTAPLLRWLLTVDALSAACCVRSAARAAFTLRPI